MQANTRKKESANPVKKSPVESTERCPEGSDLSGDINKRPMDKKGKGYFQFPLCLLGFGEDYKERLQYIVSYCLYEHARRMKSARSPSLKQAATFLGVTIQCLHDDIIGQWKQANAFVREREGRYGKDPLVRIATTLLWEAHDNTGLSYREFSVLCAINSTIGSRLKPMRITEPRIRARAAGFKSWDDVKSELPSEQLIEEELLTPHQVRYTLEKLHQRKFFARARVGAKTVKYMLGVTDDELRAKLLQAETYQARFQMERAKKDAELIAAIRNVRERPINVGKDENKASSVLIQSPHHTDISPGIVPDINICSLNNGSENISGKNITPPSVEGGVVSLFKKEKLKKLDRSQFTKEELDFIELYHRICLPSGLGFLPVTERVGELNKVLEIFATPFDAEEWTQNFREAVEYRRDARRTNPRKYNTLVQICWKLYC